MPDIDARDRLPQRIAVAGVSGSGKSTLARHLSTLLQYPYVELDSLYHGADWRPRTGFESDVAAVLEAPRWVTEWQYTAVRDRITARADLLVWLDLPTPLVMVRVIRRTLVRSVRREVLWNGNLEPPLRTFWTDRNHIVRWAFRARNSIRALIPLTRAAHPDLTIVRLSSRREVDRWVEDLVASMTRPQ